MNLLSTSHRCGFFDACPIDENTLNLRLKTNKDIDHVNLVFEDPYISEPWVGKKTPMKKTAELENEAIWEIQLQPEYKRLQYYFELFEGDEGRAYLEDGFHSLESLENPDRYWRFFKYGWMNPADFIKPPKWAEDIVWYQIFPDRFNRDENAHDHSKTLRVWSDDQNISYKDFYGGTIRGIIEKLDYLQELGINGIYLTPIFESTSNHKYNTTNYHHIDPDFGSDEDFEELVNKAHKRGIRVMIDAVFNHSGIDFDLWQDIQKNGKASPYYDWFCIGNDCTTRPNTRDGSYYTFAFAGYMPKFNTSHPAVQDYMSDLCLEWIDKWHVDGIRFDVGNEVSHDLIKTIRKNVLKRYPETFLLGEIWTDSGTWMLGDEYDSVMNYPFLFALYDFYEDPSMSAADFMYKMNGMYQMYAKQSAPILFNFLDSHDIGRIMSRSHNIDTVLAQAALLMGLPGSPCLFYGTELAMEGDHDPENRRPFDWNKLDDPALKEYQQQLKRLIAMRKEMPELIDGDLQWIDTDGRLIIFERTKDGQKIRFSINADQTPRKIELSEHSDILADHLTDFDSENLSADSKQEVLLEPDGFIIEKVRAE